MEIAEEVDAKKDKIEAEQAWEMISKAGRVEAARQKKREEWKPGNANREEIMKSIMGRSGTLRAPTLKIGNDYLVGFNEEMYQDNLT